MPDTSPAPHTSTEDLKSFLQGCQQHINQVLDDWLQMDDCGAPQLLKAMQYSLLSGGKRVRPVLAYAAAEAVSANSPENPSSTTHFKPATDSVACALEAIHAYSLIHDDLPAMDDDELRRGQPTCHIAFDEATAILAGDGLQTLAFEVLTKAEHINPDTRLRLLTLLLEASGPAGMVGGQAIDLAAVNQQRSLNQLEHMHSLKTGALIRAAVLMGAITAGASSTQLSHLTIYANAIGLAFQVQDDILDVIADTETLGKPQGADQAHNKPTYVALLGLEGARSKAQELLHQALHACDQLDADGCHSTTRLRQLAYYIVDREK